MPASTTESERKGSLADQLGGLEAILQARIALAKRQLERTAFSDRQRTAIDAALQSLGDHLSTDVQSVRRGLRRTGKSTSSEPVPARGTYQPGAR